MNTIPKKAVQYVMATRKRAGHFKTRLVLQDGGRPWLHFGAAPNTPNARLRAEELAAERQAEAIAKNLASADFDLAPPTPRAKDAEPRPERNMRDWVKVWTANRAKRLTSADYGARTWENHIAPIVAKHIADWTRDDLRALSRSLDEKIYLSTSDDPKERARSLAPKSARNVWGVIGKMCRDACCSKLDTIRCRDDLLSGTVEGPERGVRRTKQYLYPSEFLALVGCERVPFGWRVLYAIAVYTFLRAGELAALEWGDLDLQRGLAHVHRAIDRVRAPKKLKPTKTGITRRVPVERELLKLLALLVGPNEHTTVRVLPSMPRPGALAKKLREHLDMAGVRRPELFTSDATRKAITFHDLRATGITWAAVAGTDPLKIQQRAGHTSFSTTAGYIRLLSVGGG